MKTAKTIVILILGVFLFSACKKDSKKNSNSPTAEYYFIGTVNGNAVNWEASTNGDGWAAGSSSELPNDQGEIYGSITALLTSYPGGHPQLGIEFKTFDKQEDDDGATVFNAFVTTGSWAFSNNNDFTKGNKSVVIHYLDNTGKEYSSVGAQTGSSINVISATPTSGDAYNIDSGLKITLSLSCTLYPVDGTGSSIKITNGQGTVFLDNMILNF